ncbi:MAG: biopolymer transporter ExbD [Thermodesulfobacteriota bacterium]
MWTRRKHAQEASGLDMTPLVDMVFLLIIFFMLSTTFIVLPGINVNLPKASAERITLENREIVVSVDERGAFYFNKDPVDDETMLARLRAAAASNKEARILVKGDTSCQYGRVVYLLDMVRKCELNRLAIITNSKKDGTEVQAKDAR